MAIHETLKKAEAKRAKAPKVAPESDSFAVIATGGKQYVVREGSVLKIEKLSGNHKEGDFIAFENILLAGSSGKTDIGTPMLSGAKVTGEILKIARAPKVVVIKYKAKSNYFKKRGHRQPYFLVRINKIS